jgi:uncharacterized protein
MSKDTITFAFDKSVRTIDQDGRLHVQVSNISKAIVNPYRGAEIPDAEKLGLDPDRIYFLLRDPAELAKAAPTFNNIPILDRHIPVFADAPQKEFVVGSTGTDAAFHDPYLRNSLVIWDAVAIAGIKTKEQCELSSSYRYDADMTPGTFAGVHYDGIMRNIKGNHVALVDVGRAGPDVVVGDSKLNLGVPKMGRKKLSAKAVAVKGALTAYLSGRLAQDAKLGDLTPIVGSVKASTFAQDKQTIATRVKATYNGKLAKDANLDDIVDMLDSLGGDDEEDMGEDDAGGTPSAQLMALLQGAGLAPEVLTQVADLCGKMAPPAVDALPGAAAPAGGIAKPAMDAAIAEAVKKAEAATVARMQAIAQAEKDVAPIIGTVVAQDSAEAVYKLALDHAGVKTDGVHPSAFRAMVGMIGKQSEVKTVATVAMDADSVSDFAKRFPSAGKMKGGV